MNRDADKEIIRRYDSLIKVHQDKIDELRRLKKVELQSLQFRCMQQYGQHEDSGTMFHGFCVRCGAFLG